ncbi:hypothetical protein D3C85_1413470 [compost metagenome]
MAESLEWSSDEAFDDNGSAGRQQRLRIVNCGKYRSLGMCVAALQNTLQHLFHFLWSGFSHAVEQLQQDRITLHVCDRVELLVGGEMR